MKEINQKENQSFDQAKYPKCFSGKTEYIAALNCKCRVNRKHFIYFYAVKSLVESLRLGTHLAGQNFLLNQNACLSLACL